MKIFKRQKGFTLVEVIVAIGLLGAVSVATGLYISDSFKDSNKLANKAEVQSSVSALMNNLERAIKMSDIPVVDKDYEDKNFSIVKPNGEEFNYEFNKRNKKITVKNEDDKVTNTYEFIEKIVVEPSGDRGAKITVTGQDNLYSVTSTYYTRIININVSGGDPDCVHIWSDDGVVNGICKEIIKQKCSVCGATQETEQYNHQYTINYWTYLDKYYCAKYCDCGIEIKTQVHAWNNKGTENIGCNVTKYECGNCYGEKEEIEHKYTKNTWEYVDTNNCSLTCDCGGDTKTQAHSPVALEKTTSKDPCPVTTTGTICGNCEDTRTKNTNETIEHKYTKNTWKYVDTNNCSLTCDCGGETKKQAHNPVALEKTVSKDPCPVTTTGTRCGNCRDDRTKKTNQTTEHKYTKNTWKYVDTNNCSLTCDCGGETKKQAHSSVALEKTVSKDPCPVTTTGTRCGNCRDDRTKNTNETIEHKYTKNTWKYVDTNNCSLTCDCGGETKKQAHNPVALEKTVSKDPCPVTTTGTRCGNCRDDRTKKTNETIEHKYTKNTWKYVNANNCSITCDCGGDTKTEAHNDDYKINGETKYYESFKSPTTGQCSITTFGGSKCGRCEDEKTKKDGGQEENHVAGDNTWEAIDEKICKTICNCAAKKEITKEHTPKSFVTVTNEDTCPIKSSGTKCERCEYPLSGSSTIEHVFTYEKWEYFDEVYCKTYCKCKLTFEKKEHTSKAYESEETGVCPTKVVGTICGRCGDKKTIKGDSITTHIFEELIWEYVNEEKCQTYCKCGKETKKESHEWGVVSEIQSTCCIKGKTEYECIKNGCIGKKTEEKPLVDHNYGEFYVSAGHSCKGSDKATHYIAQKCTYSCCEGKEFNKQEQNCSLPDKNWGSIGDKQHMRSPNCSVCKKPHHEVEDHQSIPYYDGINLGYHAYECSKCGYRSTTTEECIDKIFNGTDIEGFDSECDICARDVEWYYITYDFNGGTIEWTDDYYYYSGSTISFLSDLNYRGTHFVEATEGIIKRDKWGGNTGDLSFSITSYVPTRNGYSFVGWTDGTNTYKNGDTVYQLPVSLDNNDGMYFTAVWQEESSSGGSRPLTYNVTVKYYCCNGSNCSNNLIASETIEKQEGQTQSSISRDLYFSTTCINRNNDNYYHRYSAYPSTANLTSADGVAQFVYGNGMYNPDLVGYRNCYVVLTKNKTPSTVVVYENLQK